MIIESDNLTLYQQYWQRQNTDYSYQTTSEKDYVDQRLSALVYTYGKTEKKKIRKLLPSNRLQGHTLKTF